jgi:uncharacterized membrane protein
MAKTAQNNSLAPRKKKGNVRKVTTTLKFSGPLPPPQVLIKYEEATHGAADRIIAMAEKQAQHRQAMEQKVVHSNIHNERLGMYFAFILTVSIMALGTYLLMNDKQVEGFIALFAPALFQAGNYIYNKYEERKHAEDRDEDSEE